MRAYKETYLNSAADSFGSMLDYAVNDCKLDGDDFLQMFIASGFAAQFERGNPKIIAGLSGVDLANKIIETVIGAPPATEPQEPLDYRTEAFWAGWILARYQWYTARRFSAILRILPFALIIQMYHPLHEAPESKFFEVAEQIYAEKSPETNLKRFRQNAGFSQSALADEAGVSLRSIQMYEQRNKDINKAQVITIAKLARALGCDVEDLLESEENRAD